MKKKLHGFLDAVSHDARLEKIMEAVARDGGKFDPATMKLSHDESTWLLVHFDEVRDFVENEARIAELRRYLRASFSEARKSRHKVVQMRRRADGFTLIEFACVAAILGFCMLLMAPSFKSFLEHQRIQSAAYTTVSAMRLARARSVSTSKNYMLAFDVPGNRLILSTVDHFAGAQDTTKIKEWRYERPVRIDKANFNGKRNIVFYPGGDCSATGEADLSNGREVLKIETLMLTGKVTMSQQPRRRF